MGLQLPSGVFRSSSRCWVRGLGCAFNGRCAVAAGLLASLVQPVLGQVVAEAGIAAGQETVVTANGTLREVSGGGMPVTGSNIFYRLQQFNTTVGGISGVKFLNPAGRTEVVVGVSNPTVISVPVELQTRGNFYLLSPLGLQILPGAGFVGVNTLMLTTSRKLSMVGGEFDAMATTDFSALSGAPGATPAALLADGLKEANAAGAGYFTASDGAQKGIEIAAGVTLSVDRSILLASNFRLISIQGAVLAAAGAAAGDGLFVVGQAIAIDQSTLKSNAQVVLREPLPAGDHATLPQPTPPAGGMLASPKISSNCSTVGGVVSCASAPLNQNRPDTLSSLKLTNTTIGDVGAPASTWNAVLKVTGWGCRDQGAQCPAGDQGGFAQIGAASTGSPNPGRRAFRGFDLTNVSIAPGSGVANLDVTVSLDWGAISAMKVVSPSTVTARAVRFQTANGGDIKPTDQLVVNFAASLGLNTVGLTAAQLRQADPRVETYALGWSLGKVSDVSNAANANVSYSGVWYDGGDATFNNISIAYISTPAAPAPAPAPAPAASSPSPAAVKPAAFEQVLFNFDQTVFSDADSTVVSAPVARGAQAGMAQQGATVAVQLDAPTIRGATSAQGSDPGAAASGGASSSSGAQGAGEGQAQPSQDDDDKKKDQPQRGSGRPSSKAP